MFEERDLGELDITENQRKVIKDKYLKASPTAQHWLMGVAQNVALTEILHHPEAREDEIFKGVSYQIYTYEVKGKKHKYYLLHQGLSYGERGKNFKKFLENLAEVAKHNPNIMQRFQETKAQFYKILSTWQFLPNSPTLMNAGRDLQQLSACYVLPVGDSIEEIYDSVKNMAVIHKSGGGTGFSFSRLRPTNDVVKTTHGVSSGPVSFMGIFDKSTDVVKQGGTRRGANMGILHCTHPNILEFIEAKNTPGILENFNISVALDEVFMKAVKENKKYDLLNPRTKEPEGALNARDVFEKMVENAWRTGDPGFVVLDRINNTESNPTPNMGQIESTNPCGEQPLLPYEPCNLGSINLSKFVKEDGSDMLWDELQECVKISTRFLDDVIDVNNYPLPKIEYMSKINRRIGLGVMGWAETLVKLGIPYNTEDAFKKAEEVMKFINGNALKLSEELATERGAFPNYNDSIYDKDGKFFRGKSAVPRNSTRTTIAPTGTIGITAGLQGTGIEPFFAIAYVRYNAAGIDALKRGETPDPENTFWEVNPLFKEIARKHNFFGLSPEELWKKIDENHKAVKGIAEIPEEIQNLFLTSHDLDPFDHVKMQCGFQKYIDNAVSKTVNLRNEATIEDVRKVYLKAYELGAKGVTIYRDGSKQFQILNLTDKKSKETSQPQQEREAKNSRYYKINTGQGPLHVHINYDDEGPLQIFMNISPAGTEISGLCTSLGIMLSKYLEQNGDPKALLKHLNSIKGDKPFGFGPKRVDSIPHAVAKVLKDHLVETGHFTQTNGQTTLHKEGIKKKDDKIYCPTCFSSNVEMVSGCSEPTCFDCGYSKCS